MSAEINIPRCSLCRAQDPSLSFSRKTRSLYCSKCRNVEENTGLRSSTSTMQCTGPCGKEYPATPEFFYYRRRKAVMRVVKAMCKECTSNKAKEYYQENRAKILKRQNSYYETAEVKKHIPTRVKEYNSQPGVKKRKNERQKSYKHSRRARERDVLGTHTPAQIQDQLKRQRHKCYYCHARLKKQKGKYIYHIEHTFPLSRVAGTDIPANSIDYIVLSCPTCNLSKGNKFPWEWPEGGRLL